MYFYMDSGGFLIDFHMDYNGFPTVFIKFIMDHMDSNGSTTDSLWILIGTLWIPGGFIRIPNGLHIASYLLSCIPY